MNTPTDPDHTSTSHSPRVNLALQCGGSHGAFTWGVLDTLLADGRIDIEGVSGTSAGAMNAVAMAHGFAKASGKSRMEMRDSARASLEHFWEGVVKMGEVTSSISQAQRAPFDILFGGFGGLTGDQSPGQLLTDAMAGFWSKSVSPYQSNPLDINPAATDAKLIHKLRDLGKDCARLWLARRFSALGVTSRVNIARDYLDDLRVPS